MRVLTRHREVVVADGRRLRFAPLCDASTMKTEPLPREPHVVTETQHVEESAVLIERIAERSDLASRRTMELPSGRTVEARAAGGEDHVTVRSASGEIELEVRMTERGPVLRFRAADIEMSSSGDVRVDCDRFEV